MVEIEILTRSTMKVATAFIVAMLSCASAFGLNGSARTASSIMRKVGTATNKPMVQAIDIQGNRLATMVSDSIGRKLKV